MPFSRQLFFWYNDSSKNTLNKWSVRSDIWTLVSSKQAVTHLLSQLLLTWWPDQELCAGPGEPRGALSASTAWGEGGGGCLLCTRPPLPVVFLPFLGGLLGLFIYFSGGAGAEPTTSGLLSMHSTTEMHPPLYLLSSVLLFSFPVL